MLTAVHITKFRTCHNTKFKLNGPVSALIGRNGAGKTNILQAIKQVADIISIRRNETIKEQLIISINFICEEKEYSYEISRSFNKGVIPTGHIDITDALKNVTDNKIMFMKKTDNRVKFKDIAYNILPETPALYLLNSLVDNKVIKNIYNELSSMGYYHVHEDVNIDFNTSFITNDDFEKWKSNPREFLEMSTVGLKICDMHDNHQDLFKEFATILNDLNLIHEIEVEWILTASLKYVVLSFKVDGEVRFLHTLSEGTRRVLILLLNLFYDKSSVMLIEEPESSIHFGLLRKMVDIFRTYSDEHQVIFTTHSEQVLNILKPKELIFVAINKNNTVAKNTTPKMVKEIQNFLDNVGPLGEYVASTGGGDAF